MLLWFQYFIAAIQTLVSLEPEAVKLFHGGAADTVTKVSSALNLVNAITSNLAAGIEPLAGVAPTDIHPALQAHAAAVPVV